MQIRGIILIQEEGHLFQRFFHSFIIYIQIVCETRFAEKKDEVMNLQESIKWIEDPNFVTESILIVKTPKWNIRTKRIDCVWWLFAKIYRVQLPIKERKNESELNHHLLEFSVSTNLLQQRANSPRSSQLCFSRYHFEKLRKLSTTNSSFTTNSLSPVPCNSFLSIARSLQ